MDPQTGVLSPAPQQLQVQYQNQYQYQSESYQAQVQQIKQLLALVEQLIAQINAQNGTSYYYPTTNYTPDYISGTAEIDITTESATNIEDDRARLRGNVDYNSSNYAYLWFEWGQRSGDLNHETPRIRRDDDEDEDFGVTITRLNDDERYYFRAVGQDDNGRIDRGSTRSFTTDRNGHSSNNDDGPDVTTRSATNITDDSATLRGEVDMNDFRNGIVFVVYGEDEDQIRDVEDDYDTYSEVDEDGDNLQKIKVDSDLDGDDTYSVTVHSLDNNTDYYYSYCVEYEDDDNDSVLSCGSVEDFETD